MYEIRIRLEGAFTYEFEFARKQKTQERKYNLKGKIIKSNEVKPFVLDATYSSKVLLDDDIAGRETININEDTLKGDKERMAGCMKKVKYITL